MPKILIEESALDSIKRMAQEVQDQRDELMAAVQELLNREWQDDEGMETLENARKKSRKAIARCQESTKVFE